MTSAGVLPGRAATTGMALMVGAMLIVPALDILAKLLMERLPPAQVALGRFLAQSALLLPLVIASRQWCMPGRLHALAGLCLGATLFFINMALREMPVANAIAIFFVEPLILTLAAGLILGEGIGWRRLTAVAVGLLGALVVLRPNVAAYGPAALWPLAAAASFTGYMLVTRVMTLRGGRLALQFWTGVTAMAVLAAITLAGAATGAEVAAPLWPDARELALFAAIGALAVVSHQMIAQALARVEAGVVAPFQYLEIISATLLGWLVFGDFPDAVTWAGTAIIVGAGLYVFHRERRVARMPPAGGP